MNIGYSSLLPYDECAYRTRTKISTDPMIYKLDTNEIWNCKQCFSGFGPRASYMGNESSTVAGHPVATAQALVDIDSIFSNRNVVISKCRTGNVNPLNPLLLEQKHLPDCKTKYLDPITSRLTNPAFNYKEAPIDRFYNLNQNPQNHIFWDFAVNTDLEMKDNFKFKFDGLKVRDIRPKEFI